MRRHTTPRMFAALATVLTLGGIASPQDAAAYEYEETLISQYARHVPTALSNAGWVASLQDVHGGFYWDAITIHDTTSFMGSATYEPSTITGLDSNGNYVGYHPSFGSLVGNVTSGPPSSALQPCQGFPAPSDRSENGVIVGTAMCPGATAFVSSGSTSITLPLTNPATADDVSDSGQYVVGSQGPYGSFAVEPTYYSAGAPQPYYYGTAGNFEAYRYDSFAQTVTMLTQSIQGLPAGYTVTGSRAMGTNDDGAVAGYVVATDGSHIDEFPVLWMSPQVAWVLPMTAGEGCRATAINDSWEVVGSCRVSSTFEPVEAFVWNATDGARALDPITNAPTSPYLEATAINDVGQITVALQTIGLNGDPGVALLTPASMNQGNCNIHGECYTMYPNQCAGHGGDFGIQYACPLDPVDPIDPVRL